MNIIETLTNSNFLIALFAAISAMAVVFTFGAQFFDRSQVKDRIKRVAIERERMRNEEMARLRAQQVGSRSSLRGAMEKSIVKQTAEALSLR